MKQTKNVAKIIILIELLLKTAAVKPQNFYTCMPKKNWIKNIIIEAQEEERKRKEEEERRRREEERKRREEEERRRREEEERRRKEEEARRKREIEEKFKVAKVQIDNNNAWSIVADNKVSGNLDSGIYKLEVAGAKGGDGGGSGYSSCGWSAAGGAGGKGHIAKEVVLLWNPANFTASIGKQGDNGGKGPKAWHGVSRGGSGKDGGLSTLNINNIGTYKAEGGKGGGGGWSHSCDAGGGAAGANAGNGQNSGNGYVRIYKYLG